MDQDYYELKDQHNENNLFEDDTFPANGSSLFFSQNTPPDVTWLRPFVFYNQLKQIFNYSIIYKLFYRERKLERTQDL